MYKEKKNIFENSQNQHIVLFLIDFVLLAGNTFPMLFFCSEFEIQGESRYTLFCSPYFVT
jgi:hypothetical protein